MLETSSIYFSLVSIWLEIVNFNHSRWTPLRALFHPAWRFFTSNHQLRPAYARLSKSILITDLNFFWEIVIFRDYRSLLALCIGVFRQPHISYARLLRTNSDANKKIWKHTGFSALCGSILVNPSYHVGSVGGMVISLFITHDRTGCTQIAISSEGIIRVFVLPVHYSMSLRSLTTWFLYI